MDPRVGCRNLVSRLKQVVLPAPFGPISAWMLPRFTARSTPFTAKKPPNSLVSPDAARMISSLVAIAGGLLLLPARRLLRIRQRVKKIHLRGQKFKYLNKWHEEAQVRVRQI